MSEREQRIGLAIFEAVRALRGLQEILDEDPEPDATDTLPDAHVASLRETFNDDALRRLVRAEEGYCRSHAHYIPSLAAYLLNERVRLREREQQLREKNEEIAAAMESLREFNHVEDEPISEVAAVAASAYGFAKHGADTAEQQLREKEQEQNATREALEATAAAHLHTLQQLREAREALRRIAQRGDGYGHPTARAHWLDARAALSEGAKG